MSKQITITLPDSIHEALTRKGRIMESGPGDVLRQQAVMSALGAEVPLGLKSYVDAIELERSKTNGGMATTTTEPGQAEMPLGGGRVRGESMLMLAA